MADGTRERDCWDDHEQRESAQHKRPFDTSGIDWTPREEKNDPPYRDWWVIEPDNECERDNE